MSRGEKIKARRNPALLIIAGCFAMSAIARVADADLASAVDAEASEPRSSVSTVSAESEALLKAIRERQEQLDRRARRLDEKARIIEAGELRLRSQLAALEDAENRLSSLMQVADSATDEDVGMLVAAFQNMDGKRAAPIFESMDVAFAAGLISRMGETAAADILSALPPESAYAITVKIAGQNARAPTK